MIGLYVASFNHCKWYHYLGVFEPAKDLRLRFGLSLREDIGAAMGMGDRRFCLRFGFRFVLRLGKDVCAALGMGDGRGNDAVLVVLYALRSRVVGEPHILQSMAN